MLVLLLASSLTFARQMTRREVAPLFVQPLLNRLEPLRSVNGYGLFARMTTVRNEIVIEGSDDGTTWVPYEFPWKPGDVMRRPTFVAPHQPRLDWQMWFAALTPARAIPEQWFTRLLSRLLEGEPTVLALFASNPFPNAPPQLVRGGRVGVPLQRIPATRVAHGGGASGAGSIRRADRARIRSAFPAVPPRGRRPRVASAAVVSRGLVARRVTPSHDLRAQSARPSASEPGVNGERGLAALTEGEIPLVN
mgnify:CR=1 FL=1